MLIANQLSIGLALVIVLAMVGRAQSRILDWRPAYDPASVIVTTIDLARTGYAGRSAGAFYDRFAQVVEAMPAVRAVAFAGPPPFRGANHRPVTTLDGKAGTQLVSCRAVSPGFFGILGIHLREGRIFTETRRYARHR